MNAKDTIEAIERDAPQLDGAGDRFSGYAIVGLPFQSGHILALRRFSASSIGPGYTSVWHRDPSGSWTFYSTVAPDLSCARYFGGQVERNVVASIEIAWADSTRFRVAVGNVIEWHVALGSSIATRLLNIVAGTIPERAWQSPALLRVMGRVAEATLGTGRMNFTGQTPNGHPYIANPRKVWLIESSHALVDGVSVGPVGPLADQAAVGDLLLPQRGLFAVARTRLEQPVIRDQRVSLSRQPRQSSANVSVKRSVPMNPESTIQRRRFLGRMFGAAAAAGLSLSGTRAAATESTSDDWIKEVKGSHRCLFDSPQHKNGYALLHILNYLNTYSVAYKTAPGQVGAVGTFYSAGNQASIPLAFNDAIWAKYELGVYTGLKDADGKAYTRNVFNRPTAKDLHLLMQSIDSPMIPALADAMPALGIESLQKMGTKFILCANALGIWCLELEARGKGKAQDIEKDLRANLLPGVTIVPAMVIAIEKAQEAGIRYNRQ
jgi:hypothetical protein